jgi:hypothetical protein
VAQLGVHAIGAGYGETIVIDFPDGSRGVIDPFCGDRDLTAENRADVHPIIRFLGPSPSLRFVALTHPHADHCMGFSHFIEHFAANIHELWLPDGWNEIRGRKYLAALKARKKCERTEEGLSADPGTILAELQSIDRWGGRRDYIKSDMVKRLVCGEHMLEFVFLAPDARALDEAQKVVSDALGKARVDDDSPWIVLKPEALPADARWNLLSTVMLLRWGKVELLFCGDAESGTWDRIIGTEAAPKQPGLVDWCVTYVKIGHHGSNSGLNDHLYGYLGCNSDPVGVLTPFNHGSPDKRLPTSNGVAVYGAHLGATYTTCRRSSLHAGVWQQPPEQKSADLGLPPERLTTVIERYLLENPSLAAVLCSASEEQVGQWLSSSEGIPAHMLDEFELRPELAFDFHPVIRQPLLAATGLGAHSVENQFRVSHYFTDTGGLHRCELGSGAGTLVKASLHN